MNEANGLSYNNRNDGPAQYNPHLNPNSAFYNHKNGIFDPLPPRGFAPPTNGFGLFYPQSQQPQFNAPPTFQYQPGFGNQQLFYPDTPNPFATAGNANLPGVIPSVPLRPGYQPSPTMFGPPQPHFPSEPHSSPFSRSDSKAEDQVKKPSQ